MTLLRSVILIGLIGLMTGCGGRVTPQPTPLQGIPLQEVCDRYHVKWQWDGVTQVVMLEYRGNKAKALVGSHTVLIGRDKIELSAPLRRDKSIIYVPEDFESRVLAPFGVITAGMPKVDLSALKVKTVVIDPGHGGKDPGTKGATGLREKDVVLPIALELKKLLEEAGLTVIMTRTSDSYPTLPQRTEIATDANADIFVSIHANFSPSRKVQGMEVYYVKTQFKKDLDEEQRTKNEKMFTKQLSSKYSPTLKHIVAEMMYQRKVESSQKLAQMIVRQTSELTRSQNRGAKNCRFAVVRNTLMPAVLIEVGYLSNREDERRLAMSSYREKLAEGIAQSILDYAND